MGGGGDDRGKAIRQLADGGFIISGYTNSFGAGDLDFYLVRTDAAGNELWHKTYGGSGTDYCYAVEVTPDSGFVMVGRTGSFGAGNDDMYVVRTDSHGDSLWTWTYGGPQNDWATDVKITPKGDYLITGGTESFGAGSADAILIRLQSDCLPEAPVGYVTLISPGPPDWGYRLNWISGALSKLVFTNFCDGTEGSLLGDAATDWTMLSGGDGNDGDSIIFLASTPLTSGTIDTFWLSHPWCSDVVDWTAGDSSGSVDGPLPVEMTTFQAVASDGQVTLQWRTESELDNDHFVLYKRRVGQEDFHALTEIPGHGTTSEPHDYQFVDSWVQNGIAYDYQISDVDIAGRETFYEQIVSATPGRDVIPTEFALHQNYPNPFNPTTTIRYDVKEAGLVSLIIFDLLGREVATLTHEEHSAGSYSTTWDAAGMPSGIYLCKMEADGFAQTRKLILLK